MYFFWVRKLAGALAELGAPNEKPGAVNPVNAGLEEASLEKNKRAKLSILEGARSTQESNLHPSLPLDSRDKRDLEKDRKTEKITCLDRPP